jgi:hypothetical protein
MMPRRQPYAAYSPDEHVRIQLGITESECTPSDDSPGVSVRFTITANLVSTNAPVLRVKALDAIARGKTQWQMRVKADFERRQREAARRIVHATRRLEAQRSAKDDKYANYPGNR